MIKTAAAGPGHVRDYAVHDLAVLLINVEVLIEKMAQITSALRDANSIDAMHGSDCLWVILQVRKKITHCRQTDARHRRIFRGVNDLVNLSGKESTVQVDEVGIVDQLTIHLVCETPLSVGNVLARTGRSIARCKYIEGTRWIVHSIALAAGWAEEDVA